MSDRWPETLNLLTAPNPVLSKRADEIGIEEQVPEYVVQRMQEIRRAHSGIGLAGPQVGVSLRLFVVDPALGLDELIINPRILETGREATTESEGCLSLPGYWLPVRRPSRVRVYYRATDGTREQWLEGHAARVFQHELDHLDGILISRRFAELFEA